MRKKYLYEDIKLEFEERGYILLSTQYTNCETKLQFICNKHVENGIQEIDYNHFHNRNQGCKYCGIETNGVSKRVDSNKFKEITELKGFIYCGYKYINKSAHIEYKCPNHLDKGIQIMTYLNMKKSTGKCSYCYGRHKTTIDFINQMKIKDPNIEILGEYINATTKIRCRCLIDGCEWEAKPNLLLCATGCPTCGLEKSRINSTKTHSKFISEMKFINPNIEILSQYTNVKELIICRCKICNNEWKTTPDSLLTGHGCTPCSLNKSHDNQVKSNEQFLKELSIINPNIQPLEEYYNDHTKIKCRCLIHNHVWYATPNKILHRKTGCPKCTIYQNEITLNEILDNWGFKYTLQKRFNDCRDKNTLPFDKYLDDFNILIEYDGEGHYYPIRRGTMTEEDAINNYNLVKFHDSIKTEYCKKNNIPLIRIPYWKRENMEYFLFDELVKCGVIEEINKAS